MNYVILLNMLFQNGIRYAMNNVFIDSRFGFIGFIYEHTLFLHFTLYVSGTWFLNNDHPLILCTGASSVH